MKKEILAVTTALFTILACSGGGSVARFAPCTSTDTCPSGTVCEVATSSDTSATQTFCTWSCTDDDFDEQLCPSDANGTQGICISSIGQNTIGQEDEYGFCFQSCDGGTCPDGEVCSQAGMYRGGAAMVCVPTPADALSGTSWTSTTITPIAQGDGVTSLSYTMVFGVTNGSVDGFASGDFSGTFSVKYAASAPMRAGCSETTTLASAGWVDVPTQEGSSVLSITGTQSTTTRTGCVSSADDLTNDTGDWDLDTDDNGASFTIAGTKMTLHGGDGAVPFDDGTTWTFTKQ